MHGGLREEGPFRSVAETGAADVLGVLPVVRPHDDRVLNLCPTLALLWFLT